MILIRKEIGGFMYFGRMNKILDKIKSIEHGFKHIIEAGDHILSTGSGDPLALAIKYMDDESYQVRMLATYMLGQLSVTLPAALRLLETKVATDDSWRVQEMLAKAFDHYCQSKGYNESLPVISRWLSNKNPAVRRAVIEGLRIWTGRPYFKEHPDVAIELIAGSRDKAGDSQYLLKSVGNALHDIRKKYPALVDREISGWDPMDKAAERIKKIAQK